jgi:ParB family chromosome partitioning protein
VNDDDSMYRLSESIRKEGVRIPGLARPLSNGGYGRLCGNRRKRASELAGIPDMPIIIRDLDDDAAVLVMVDNSVANTAGGFSTSIADL